MPVAGQGGAKARGGRRLAAHRAQRHTGSMAHRTWWHFAAWVFAWVVSIPVLALTLSGLAGRAVPVVSALSATIAAALLAAFGWGARSERAPPAPWRWSVLLGGALLAAGIGAGVTAGIHPSPRAVLPAAAAAVVLVGYHRWTERGLPPGFAYRITGAARACAMAAAALWAVAVAHGATVLTRLPARALGAAAYLGVGPFGAGAILWEYVRPGLRGGGRAAKRRSRPKRPRAGPDSRAATARPPG